jgi:CrcB protein
VARYWLAGWLDDRLAASVPDGGVLLVNLLGCLLIGLLSAVISDVSTRAAVLTGLLGGFTTYSAFALLTHEFAAAGRWPMFCVQVTAHLVGGLLCVGLGLWIGRALVST